MPDRPGFFRARALVSGFAALCTAVLLSACGGGGGSDSATVNNGPGSNGGNGGNGGAQAKWTYLVYMAADNTLSEMADINIEQMKAARSSSNVRVVVQVDQSAKYTSGASPTTLRGTIGGGSSQLTSMGRNVNMADKASLAEFIRWGKQTYPADHYAVVLWSHGGGWRANKLARGALQDVSVSEGIMSVKDIAWALQDAGGVDLLNFDACLMAMYEVAFELRHAAKVLVGSEESIPGLGNPYDKIINRLIDSPTQDAVALGRAIVAEYDAFYRARNRDSVQLSAIDLTQVDALDLKVRESAALLLTSLTSDRLNIEASRDVAVSYTYPNHRDLVGFATDLATRSSVPALRTKMTELAAAARATVLSNKVLVVAGQLPIAASNGLAIYIPGKTTTTTEELNAYRTALASSQAVGAGKTWNDFAVTLVTGSSGTSPTNGSGAFAYGIGWDNPDVDLDLYVNEPQGTWAGPAWGTTSVNSFSSADSYDSGEPIETYTGNNELEEGGYDVFVRHVGCHAGKTNCGATTVTVYRYDPTDGDAAPVVVATRRMAATPALDVPVDPFNQFIAAISTNNYADWLYVQRTSRALSATSKVVSPEMKHRSKALRAPVQK
jgi:hypothetical protein